MKLTKEEILYQLEELRSHGKEVESFNIVIDFVKNNYEEIKNGMRKQKSSHKNRF